MKKTLIIIMVILVTFAFSSCTNDVKTNNNCEKMPLISSENPENQEEPLILKVEQIDKKVNLKAVGDIVLARGVASRINGDYLYPFREVSEFLSDADITFGNLECSLSNRGQALVGKGVWLRTEPKAVQGLKYIGLDIANIGNNHIMDYNEPAMLDTIDVLEENNIKHIGAGKNLEASRQPAIFEVNNVKVGFLGYTDLYQYGYWVSNAKKKIRFVEAKDDISGVAPLKFDIIKEDIEKLRDKVDILIVSLHWGVEESFEVPKDQRKLAHDIIDAGADMILGHHPHQMQGVEVYDNKPIIYSMGNFIFDQNDKENNETMILDVDFIDNKIARLEIVPLKIVDKKKTVFVDGDEAQHIMGYLKKFSNELDTNASIENNKLVFDIK